MTTDRPDPFVQFADRHRVELSMEPLPGIPRDIAAPPRDQEAFVLITCSAARADAEPLRLVFVSSAAEDRAATVRDGLWWLAADSWAVERAGGDFGSWCAIYDYPDDDPATIRLFRLHADQARRLCWMLGEAVYQELLALYASELRSSG